MISTMFFLLTFPPNIVMSILEGYWMSRFVTTGLGTLAENSLGSWVTTTWVLSSEK